MIVMRYILCFLFLGGCWHAGAVALGSHVLMLAPHGRRAPECFENPAYSQELGCGDRASPAFYDTVRRIHAGLAAASGEDE